MRLYIYTHVFVRTRLIKEDGSVRTQHMVLMSDTGRPPTVAKQEIDRSVLAGFAPTLFPAMRSRVQNLIAFRAKPLAIVQTSIAPNRFFRGKGREKKIARRSDLTLRSCQAASIVLKYDDVVSKHDDIVSNANDVFPLSRYKSSPND